MIKIGIRLLICFGFISGFACNSREAKKNMTLSINHYRVPCTGTGVQLCYLIKKEDQSDWEFLYEGIEGFQYVWGREYKLEVEEFQRENPMADQSKYGYRLIKVIESKPVEADRSFSFVVKDSDISALEKDSGGALSLLGQYPVRCDSKELCAELDQALRSGSVVKCNFQHGSDFMSIVLKSISQ